MKELEIDEVFIYYTEPQVMSATDEENKHYICTLYDVDNLDDLNYVVVEVSNNELQDLVLNQIDLLSVYQDRPIYKAIDVVGNIFYIDSEITPEPWMLPDSGLYISDEE